ncbi:MAG: molybdopterin oxidoreductase family protein [Candidatus Binatia bacterium]
MPAPLLRDGVVHSVCPHDCADTCSILSHVESGRLVRVEGNPAHPVTRGFLCRKVSAAPRRVYAEDRILSPLRRVGAKGEARFEAISWDAALAHIAERWRAILAQDGPRAILPFFGSGTEGLVHGHIAGRRFFNRLGSLQLERTICTRAGRIGYRYTMGSSAGADPMRIADVTLAIDWGVHGASTHLHHQSFLQEARRRGTEYAVINPIAVEGAAGAEHFLQPRPGSDAALALGLMHVIIGERLYDADFVERYTLGFDQLRARAAEYPPERVAALTDVPAAQVRGFARRYAALRPSFIFVGPGCQRHSNGGMTVRTIACLPALVGAWRQPGGGIYYPTSTAFPADFSSLEGEALRREPAAGYNMIHLARLLDGAGVRSLYVFDGNPAAVLYDQRRLRRGLAREDLFTVVHERHLTDTARYADVVLPATTQFEQEDLLFSYYHPSLLWNRQAIAPLGECRSNLTVFRDLARVLGFEEACFRQDEREVIADILALDQPAIAGVDRERLFRDGWAPAGADPEVERFARHDYPTPSGRIELYSERMRAAGLDPLPAYQPPVESREASPELFARHPLHLLSPSGHSIHNSNYGQAPGFRRSEERPLLLVHPEDAAARGIREGDRVRVFNDRGDCALWAHLSTDVRPGVIVAAGQWWSRHYPDGGNVNHTTPDFLADMGGGSAFNTNLVQLEACAERPAAG